MKRLYLIPLIFLLLIVQANALLYYNDSPKINYTGAFSTVGQLNCSLSPTARCAYDHNWYTGTYGSGTGTWYANYSINLDLKTSVYMNIRNVSGQYKNRTIPLSCAGENTITIRYVSKGLSGPGNWTCKNITSNAYTNFYSTSGEGVVYELRLYLGYGPSYNITFRDEQTGLILNTSNITLRLYGSGYLSTQTIRNGTVVYRDLNSSNYTLVASGTRGYTQRTFTIPFTNATTNQTLYLSNTTDVVTATVVDEALNPIEGVKIRVLRGLPPTTAEIFSSNTNFEGQAQLDLELNSIYYTFILEYPEGTVVQQTNPTLIFSDTITFQVVLAQNYARNYRKYQNLYYTIAFNDSGDEFYATYIDSNNITVSSACLNVYAVNIVNNTLFNSTCVTGESGVLYVGVANVTGRTYRADLYVTWADGDPFIDSLVFEFLFSNPLIGSGLGAFMQALTTIAFMFVFAWDAPLMLPGIGLSIIWGRFFGFNQFDWGIISTLCVILVIVYGWIKWRQPGG